MDQSLQSILDLQLLAIEKTLLAVDTHLQSQCQSDIHDVITFIAKTLKDQITRMHHKIRIKDKSVVVKSFQPHILQKQSLVGNSLPHKGNENTEKAASAISNSSSLKISSMQARYREAAAWYRKVLLKKIYIEWRCKVLALRNAKSSFLDALISEKDILYEESYSTSKSDSIDETNSVTSTNDPSVTLYDASDGRLISIEELQSPIYVPLSMHQSHLSFMSVLNNNTANTRTDTSKGGEFSGLIISSDIIKQRLRLIDHEEVENLSAGVELSP